MWHVISLNEQCMSLSCQHARYKKTRRPATQYHTCHTCGKTSNNDLAAAANCKMPLKLLSIVSDLRVVIWLAAQKSNWTCSPLTPLDLQVSTERHNMQHVHFPMRSTQHSRKQHRIRDHGLESRETYRSAAKQNSTSTHWKEKAHGACGRAQDLGRRKGERRHKGNSPGSGSALASSRGASV